MRGAPLRIALPLLGVVALAAGCRRDAPGRPKPPPAPLRCGDLPAPRPAVDLTPPDPDAATVSVANLRSTVAALADPARRGRAAGSPEDARVSWALATRLHRLGARPAAGPGDACQRFAVGRDRSQNVLAWLRPPRVGEPVVLLGAHHDGQGLLPSGEVAPSADDNASGVAAVLEVARLLRRHPRPGDPAVLVALFGAEEQGRLGSQQLALAPPVPVRRLALMVNLDQVGRPLLDGNPLRRALGLPGDLVGYVISHRESESVRGRLDAAAQATATRVIGIPEALLLMAGFSSDSVTFSPHAPTLFLSTGAHTDQHGAGDTVARLDLGQTARVVRLVLEVIRGRGTPPAR